MAKAKLIDVTKCSACRGCQTACKNWNQLPAAETEFTGSYENPPSTLPQTWTKVNFNEVADNGEVKWRFAKIQCMHCGEPACMEICPAEAISKTALGSVVVDHEKCIGCGACEGACPFGIPKVDQVAGVMKKCTLCSDRVSNDLLPACVKACPTGALDFGDREEMLAKAEERVAELQEKGVSKARVYGAEEMGGLGVIYVLADDPSAYGLPEDPSVAASFYLWKYALAPVRMLATVGMAAGMLSGLVKLRRDALIKEKEAE